MKRDDGGGKLQSGASGSGQHMPTAQMTGKNFFRAVILARALNGVRPRNSERSSKISAFSVNQRGFVQLSCSAWV